VNKTVSCQKTSRYALRRVVSNLYVSLHLFVCRHFRNKNSINPTKINREHILHYQTRHLWRGLYWKRNARPSICPYVCLSIHPPVCPSVSPSVAIHRDYELSFNTI